jgi:hypothetical protein
LDVKDFFVEEKENVINPSQLHQGRKKRATVDPA